MSKHNPNRRLWGRLYPVVIAGFTVVLLCSAAAVQSIWEVTPYRIHTWVHLDSSAALPQAWGERFASQLVVDAESKLHAVWSLTASAIPAQFRGLPSDSEAIQWERVTAVSPKLKEMDKLLIVTLAKDLDGYVIRVSEYDLLTHVLSSPLERRRLLLARQLASATLDLMCEVFAPIIRIERIEQNEKTDKTLITALARAGSLVRPEQSPRYWTPPTVVSSGDVLQPVIRKSDRNGLVGPKGVKPVEWTLLTAGAAPVDSPDSDTGSAEGESEEAGEAEAEFATTQKVTTPGTVHCTMQSGYRQPFRLRRSSRIEQIAYVVKPAFEATILRCVDRRQPDSPLIGYEVLTKLEEGAPSVSLGRTDWRGELRVQRNLERPVQILFVRSGQQLLGKLPIVGGQQRELVAPLRNDDLRLEAEGFLMGVQDSLVDLVARREVLANRIRVAISDDKLDLAEELLDDLRGLDTQEDFSLRVQQRKRTLSTNDGSVQERIDDLFTQTSTLLGQYLNPQQVETLAQSLREAKAKSGS